MTLIRNVPHEWQAAYFGALIAIAHADGDFDNTEEELLRTAFERLKLHERVEREIKKYLKDPPDLSACLHNIGSASDEFKFSLMVHMLDVALADGVLAIEEQRAIVFAANLMGVSEEQVQALFFFVSRADEFRSRTTSTRKRFKEIDKCVPVLRSAGLPEAVVPLLSDLVGRVHGEFRDPVDQNNNLEELLAKSRERRRVLRMRELVDELCQKSA